MDKQQHAKGLIIQQGVLPLFYHADDQVSIAIVKALYNAGIRAIEYTNRGENALENFVVSMIYVLVASIVCYCLVHMLYINQQIYNNDCVY